MKRWTQALCIAFFGVWISVPAWCKSKDPLDGIYPTYMEPTPDDSSSSASDVSPLTTVVNDDNHSSEISSAAPEPQTPSSAPAMTETSSASSAAPASPEEKPAVVARPATTDHYRVWIWQENGDCLWRIAEKMYGDRSKWQLIYLANRDIIRDPNKIYPKQKLKIPPPDWQP